MSEQNWAQGQRIVVGIGGSECSRAVLAWALVRAGRCAGLVEIVTAAQELPRTHKPGLRYTATAAARFNADLLARVRIQLGNPPVAVRTRIMCGDPAELLLEAAVGAQLLVVGRGGAELGPVGRRCVRDAPCEVAVVEADDPSHMTAAPRPAWLSSSAP